MRASSRLFRYGCLLVLLTLFLTPAFAERVIKDVPSSQNGFSGNCNSGNGGPCLYFQGDGTVLLNGTDANGLPITVSVTLSDWGNTDANGVNHISNVVLDLMLQGSDTTLTLQSFIMSGVQSAPTYVSCEESNAAIPCNSAPLPDSQDLQEPTPIAGSDGTNTQWDFGTTQSIDQFINVQTLDTSCFAPCLGEAIVAIDGAFATDHLSLSTNNYLAVVTDGSGHVFNVGGMAIPPTATPATNNTQATAISLPGPTLPILTDTSQLSPSEDSTGKMVVPQGFVLPPPPSCNPTGDARVFRTAWYSYVPPSDGSLTVTTANSHYDTLVYVLNASNGNSEVACNDDPSTGGLLQALIATPFTVSAGMTYNIIVMQTPPEQTVDSNGVQVGYPLSTDGTLSFNYQFTPAAPSASLSTGTLVFAGQLINTVSNQPIVLTNAGPGALSIASIAVSGSGFAQTNTCPASPATLAPGVSCTINIAFAPAGTGSASGTLTETDSASNSPHTASLSGEGTDFQASAAAFASTTISPGQSTTANITISATGFSSSLTLSCSIAPAAAIPPSCSLSPASLPNGSGTSTLTVSTVAPGSSLSAVPVFGPRIWFAAIFPFGMVWLSRRRLQLLRSQVSGGFFLIVVLMLILITMVACGGGSSTPVTQQGGTSPGAYTITVTALGGGGSRSVMLPLTVQ